MFARVVRAALLVALGSGAAFAAEPDKPDNTDKQDKRDKREKWAGHAEGRGHGAARDRLREEVFDQIRAMRMWKLTEELKLDEATAAKVFPLLARFDERRREISHERLALFRELQDLMKAPNPDVSRLTAVIDRMTATHVRRLALEEERFKELRRVLTPLQQAKLILVLPKLEESVREKIRDVVGRGRDPGHDRPDRPDRPDPGLEGDEGGERPKRR